MSALATPAPQPRQCPKCQSAQVRRSHRVGWAEKAFCWTGFYPYRCHECSTRFHLRVKSAAVVAPTDKRRERTQQDKKRKLRVILLFGVSLVLFTLIAHYVILRAPVFSGE